MCTPVVGTSLSSLFPSKRRRLPQGRFSISDFRVVFALIGSYMHRFFDSKKNTALPRYTHKQSNLSPSCPHQSSLKNRKFTAAGQVNLAYLQVCWCVNFNKNLKSVDIQNSELQFHQRQFHSQTTVTSLVETDDHGDSTPGV